MDYRQITSRQALKAEKARIFNELKRSSKDLQTDVKDSFIPVRQARNGTKIDYNKVLSYAIFAYRGFVWTRKIRSFFVKNKGKKRK